MRPVTVTTSDASGGALNSSPIPMDYNASIPFNVGIICVVTGTVAYSVQHSNDNSTWLDNANISGASATADTNYMFPVKYIRLHQASGSGSVSMSVIQTGPARQMANSAVTLEGEGLSLTPGIPGEGTVTQIVAGAGLSGGTITTSGTVALGAIAAGDLLGNSGTVSAVPGAIAIGAGLSLTVGGTLNTQWNGGTVTAFAGGAAVAGGTLSAQGAGSGSQTASSGAAISNTQNGVITSEALVGAVSYTLTLTNSKILTTSAVLVNATNSANLPVTVNTITVSSGSVVILVGMAALTGTVKIAFAVMN